MKAQKLFLALVLFIISISNLNAQTYCFTTPQGYGSATTGGGTKTPVIVTTMSALVTEINKSNNVIIVSGTLTCTSLQSISGKSNVTILGLPGATITTGSTKSGILYFKSSCSNIIIRNIIFQGPGANDDDGDDPICIDNSTKFWIDHCEFRDGWDGNLDTKNGSDNITVSWCKFWYPLGPGSTEHRFTNLVGKRPSDAGADGKFSITYQYNWWAEGCKERMPRARNSDFHMVNCYYYTSVSGAVAQGLGGGVAAYIENTDFEKVATIFEDKTDDDGGVVGAKYVNCLKAAAAYNKTEGTVSVSAPTYSYEIIPVANVKAAVTNTTCGAGATLTVTTAGVITSACSGPTLTLTSATGTDAQSVYTNNAITNITYAWGGTATGATIAWTGTASSTTPPSGISVSTSGSVTISGTPTVAGTYGYTLTTTQSSGTAATATGSIVVTDLVAPTLVLTSAAATANQSVYTNATITNIVYTYGGGATGATVTGLPTGVTATVNTTAKTVTISGSPTTSTGSPFTYTVTTVGGLTPMVSLNGTITVTNPSTLGDPTATYSMSGTTANVSWGAVANASSYNVKVCSAGGGGTSKTYDFNSETIAAYTADFALTNGTTIKSTAKTVEIRAGTGTYDGVTITKMLYLSGSGTISNCALQLTTDGAGTLTVYCNAGDNSRILHVNDGTSIISDGTSTNTVTVTIPSAGTYYLYSQSSSINIFLVKFSSASTCTEVNVPSGTTYNVTDFDSATETIYVQAVGDGIGYLTGAYVEATLASTPVPATITLTTATATETQNINTGATITPIGYTYTGNASITWTGTASSTTPPTGVTVSNVAGVISITGTPTVAGTYGYTINVTAIAGGSPATATETGTITVTTLPVNAVLTLTSATATESQTVYTSVTITPITYTYTGTLSSITWTGTASSTTPPTGITVDTGTSGQITISGTPTIAGTYSYSILVNGANGGTDATDNGSITVTTPVALSTPTNIIATPSSTSVSLDWDDVSGATGYVVNFCTTAGGIVDVTTVIDDITKTGDYFTLSSGDLLHSATATAGNPTTACVPTGYTGTINRTSSANDFSLELVATSNVTTIRFGGRSSGTTSNRYLNSYSINGGTAQTTGISGLITTQGCTTEITISGLSLTTGDIIAFTFDNNVQLSYFILTSDTGTPTCTEYTITGGTNSNYTVTGLTPSTTYSYQVKAINGTPAQDSPYSVSTNVTTTASTVNANITLTSAASTNAQTVLTNTSITNITYTYVGTYNNIVWTGTASSTTPPTGITVDTATSGAITFSGTPSAAGSYGYTINIDGIGGGSAASATGSLTVNNPTPVCTVCVGTTFDFTSLTGSPSTSIPCNLTATGLSADITLTVGGGPFEIRLSDVDTWGTSKTITNTAGSANATLQVRFNPSVIGIFDNTLIFSTLYMSDQVLALHGETNDPTIDSPITKDQTVPVNTALTNIYFTVGGSATTATLSGSLPAGVTFDPATLTISGTPTEVGVFNYTLTTDGSPAATVSGTITVTALANVAPSVAITAPTTGVCALVGETVVLTATATDSDGSVTGVNFYNGATLLGAGTDSGSTYTYNWVVGTAGAFTITAIATDDDAATTTSTNITVNVSPSVTITQNVDTLYSSVNNGNQWYNSQGAIAGATDSTYTVTEEDDYYVVVTDANGCSAMSNSIHVIPTAIAQNQFASMISVSPNPAHGYTVVNLGSVNNAKIEIVSADGKVVYNTTIKTNIETISLNGFATGLYTVKVTTDGKTIQKKLVVE